jgi:hypothetical protein
MHTSIVPVEYEGKPVQFNSAGWIHATEIAARFDKEPYEWLRLPDTERYIAALKCRYGEIPYVKKSRTRADRGGGTWLHPKLAVTFARWISVDFEIWCDEQINALLYSKSKSWATSRREAAIGYRALCDALMLNCEAQGKNPNRHHFINEAKLINEVVSEVFTTRKRDLLTTYELEIITLTELRDTALIGMNITYAERKTNLLQFANKLQSKHKAVQA